MTGQRGEASPEPKNEAEEDRERKRATNAARSRSAAPHGVLVIDKPTRPTSHDVVSRVRRALGTKRVGHAGTLDPMASGVLVMLVGEATKLAPFLTAHDKSYLAVVALGAATTTLDAEGEITLEEELPAWLHEELAAAAAIRGEARSEGPERETALVTAAPRIHAALAAERAREEQMPPAFSAIKVGGRRSYAIARAGGEPELAARPVQVRRLSVAAAQPTSGAGAAATRGSLALELDVSKGYYVRSLARDIGEHLGVPSHLASLRRTKSGPFSIASAIPLDAGPDALRAALIPLVEAARLSLPMARLTGPGAARARQGKRLDASDFDAPPPAGGELSAWLDPEERLVAVGLMEGSKLIVQRGFAKEEEEPTRDDQR